MTRIKHPKGEELLWNIVKRCLERKPYNYICSNSYWPSLKNGFIDTGIDRIRSDVIGIKEVGSWHRSKIEIIAVEVKDYQKTYTPGNMDQARRAAHFAHKCYLAAPRPFKPEEIETAVEKRIGLFEIKNRKRLIKVLPAPQATPDEHKVIQLLVHFKFYKCSICNCLINTEFIKKGSGFYVYDDFSKDKWESKWQFICRTCREKIPKKLDVAKTEELQYLWDEIFEIKKQLKKIQREYKYYVDDWGESLQNRIKILRKRVRKL